MKVVFSMEVGNFLGRLLGFGHFFWAGVLFAHKIRNLIELTHSVGRDDNIIDVLDYFIIITLCNMLHSLD